MQFHFIDLGIHLLAWPDNLIILLLCTVFPEVRETLPKIVHNFEFTASSHAHGSCPSASLY